MGYCISFLRETVRYGRFIDTQCLFLLEIAATESLFFCDSAKQIQIMVASLCNSCLHIPDFIATYCTILSTFIPIFLPIVHVLLLLAEVHCLVSSHGAHVWRRHASPSVSLHILMRNDIKTSPQLKYISKQNSNYMKKHMDLACYEFLTSALSNPFQMPNVLLGWPVVWQNNYKDLT